MSGKNMSTRISDLSRLLEATAALHEQLAVVLDEKIRAMRKANVEAMGGCEQRERALIETLQERDGLRKQLMDSIGVELGLPAKAGRTLTLSQLGLRLGESERDALGAAGERLRAAVMKVRQVERVAGAISQEVLNHLQWIFAAVKPRDDGSNGYSRQGAPVRAGGSAMVELVG